MMDAHQRLVGKGGQHSPNLRHRVVGIVVGGLAVVAAACGSADTGQPDVAVLDAERIVIGGAPWGIAVDGTTVWVSDASRATLVALDADSGRVQREVATGAPDPRDAGIVVAGGRLWVANLGGSVGVLDATSGAPIGRVAVGPGEPAAVAVTGRSAWVPLHGPGGGLARIHVDLTTEPVPIELAEPGFAVVAAGETVWVSGLDRGLFALDAETGEVRYEVDLPGAPRGVAVASGDVWVTLRDRREVVRVDGESGDVLARISTQGEPWPVASGSGSVWVAELDGRLLRIDLDSNRITGTAAIPVEARAVSVGGGAVWVTSQTGVLTRVDAERR